MPEHLRTYTITDQVTPGIDPGDFACVLSDDALTECRLHAEELPGVFSTSSDLRLWFLEPAEDGSTDAGHGVVASVDPARWQPYADTSAELLDPGGRGGRVLLYLPVSDRPALVGASGTGAVFVSGDAPPEIRQVSRGIILRWALGQHEPRLSRTPAKRLAGSTCRREEAGCAP